MDTEMDWTACHRVVVYGGSFDPPHVGHVRLPLLAGRTVEADVVAYMPTGRNPVKSSDGKASAHHRLAMLSLALASFRESPELELPGPGVPGPGPRVVILTHEIQPAIDHGDNGPNYTVETLTHLRQQLGNGIDLRFLIGGDSMRQFYQWRDPEGILRLAQPLVMVRPPADTRQDLLDSLPVDANSEAWSQRFVDLPPMDVSSSQIRQFVSQGRSITGLVRPAVERYIHEHRLYRAGV